MNDHHDEKKSPIEAEGECSVYEYGGTLHEDMAELIANVDEGIHDFVKAMDKLQERCEALESLVRDMHDLLATPAWDRGGWTTDGRCVDFDTRMAELGIEVSE